MWWYCEHKHCTSWIYQRQCLWWTNETIAQVLERKGNSKRHRKDHSHSILAPMYGVGRWCGRRRRRSWGFCFTIDMNTEKENTNLLYVNVSIKEKDCVLLCLLDKITAIVMRREATSSNHIFHRSSFPFPQKYCVLQYQTGQCLYCMAGLEYREEDSEENAGVEDN